MARPFAREFGEPAKHNREDHHCQERADDGPSDADDGLLVADSHIAPGEDREQLAIGPEVAPVMPLGPAGSEDQQMAIVHCGYCQLLCCRDYAESRTE
jgi:hypothetical protein